MLKDLLRYITTDNKSGKTYYYDLSEQQFDCKFNKYFSEILPLICSDSLYKNIINGIANIPIEMIDTLNMMDLTTTVYHYSDYFKRISNKNGHVILASALGTFLSDDDFKISTCMLDIEDYSKSKEIFSMPYKRKYEKTYIDIIDDELRNNFMSNIIDDDCMTMVQIWSIEIKFTSKSLYRKMRRLYNDCEDFRNLLGQFMITYMNGFFVGVGFFDEESYDPYYDEYDIDQIIHNCILIRQKLDIDSNRKVSSNTTKKMIMLENYSMEYDVATSKIDKLIDDIWIRKESEDLILL